MIGTLLAQSAPHYNNPPINGQCNNFICEPIKQVLSAKYDDIFIKGWNSR